MTLANSSLTHSFMMYKSDFPIFDAHPELVYLDSAATTQKPEVVIRAVEHFYRTEYATIHRALYPLSTAASERYENVRKTTAAFIGATNSQEIIFTHGATEGLNLLAHGLVKAGDEVILSALEHHANLVPWQQIPGVTIKFAELNQQGEIDLENLRGLITERTKVVSLSLCSNVLGTILPGQQVKKILTEQGSRALVIFDASQAAPHFPISVQELACDFLVFSGHKVYGPSGTGILWGRLPLLEDLPPYQTGGDMIKTVTREASTWNDVPWKFEAGTPNIEGMIGLGVALEYLMGIGMQNVQSHCEKIMTYALEKLGTIPQLHLLSTPGLSSGIISFTIDGIHPHDVAEALGEQHVCIRAGHHCAAPLHDTLGIPASNRISIGLYTTEADIDACISALSKTIAFFSHV